jgi:hypothetical protein
VSNERDELFDISLEEGAPRPGQTCRICGSENHVTSRHPREEERGAPRPGAQCALCNSENHTTSECPNTRR